ncbi:helix-turn-helix domain-containing protein [Leptobacterium flavescens]|uniref:Helix-turn-helix domain-containing protein n=1 Tax=Leptobacterium flavescens TaxID=472055 RepID=A0A6P0UPH3_9FLAO|nr:AraC family transcriptional regulator [Leptobacterium flavescens]NER12813.1 helix-turn-helix domain-containing protein [Leptobacterium flavescens]
MKVLPFKIPKSTDTSLIVQEDHVPALYDKLHQHEEIQISAIFKGEGQLIVGDSVNDFKPGDILVIGGSLPHLFKSDPSDEEKSHMMSLFFTKESFGDHFFDLPEFSDLNNLFTEAEYGFKIVPAPEDNFDFEGLKKFLEYDKLDAFINFLALLKRLCYMERKSLSSFIHKKKYTDNEGKRMSAVFELAMNEFHRDITLEEIAEVASMSPNAFCRYFKQRTNKTFFEFLIEVRIENACKLLSRRNDLSVAEIAYQCGFKNISNFNRKFKLLKKVVPSKYRKQGLPELKYS